MNKNKKIFIILLLIYICEMLMTYSISWNILENSKTKVPLAFCLGISAIIPYIVQGISDKFKNNLSNNIKKMLIMFILCGILISVFFIFMDFTSLIFNYLLISLTSIVFFLITQIIESILAINVMRNEINSDDAAKYLSLSSNLSGLIGALANGVGMQLGGLKIIIFLSVFLLIIVLIIVITMNNLNDERYYKKDITEEQKDMKVSKKLKNIYYLFIALALSTISINVLLIELLQDELNWSVLIYGILDAVAGVGAILGAYVLNNKKLKILAKFNIIGLPLTFIGLSITRNFVFMVILLFLWGIFMTTFFLKGREIAFNLTQDDYEAQKITRDIIFIRTITNAIAPLIISFIFINTIPSKSLFYIGVFLFIMLNFIKKANSYYIGGIR